MAPLFPKRSVNENTDEASRDEQERDFGSRQKRDGADHNENSPESKVTFYRRSRQFISRDGDNRDDGRTNTVEQCLHDRESVVPYIKRSNNNDDQVRRQNKY